MACFKVLRAQSWKAALTIGLPLLLPGSVWLLEGRERPHKTLQPRQHGVQFVQESHFVWTWLQACLEFQPGFLGRRSANASALRSGMECKGPGIAREILALLILLDGPSLHIPHSILLAFLHPPSERNASQHSPGTFVQLERVCQTRRAIVWPPDLIAGERIR